VTAVVKVGARTPVGLDARQTGFLLRAGFPAVTEAPLADEGGEAITMAFLPTIDPRLVGAERLVALARPPLEEAVDVVRDARAEVHVALDEGLIDERFACGIFETMVARLMPNATVSVEARGEAALGARLPAVLQALETRRLDVAVFGGVHSDYDPRIIAALEAEGRLFSPQNLDARMPGECAAFFVLMRPGDARRLRLEPLANVIGVGSGRERARPDNDHPAYEALGMTAAVKNASAPLVERGRKAGWMFTDLTFEPRRQLEWQSVFTRSQRLLTEPYIIESPGQRIGYLGAAAMPLFVAIAATAWEHGYAPSPTALAVAGADGGERAALVIAEA
jgi:3-oxoacyl-[acyl-carrier-protein] synthase I